MRIEDLDIREVVAFDSNGEIRFAGQHALIVDATALEIPRKELIDHFSFTLARAMLSRFG